MRTSEKRNKHRKSVKSDIKGSTNQTKLKLPIWFLLLTIIAKSLLPVSLLMFCHLLYLFIIGENIGVLSNLSIHFFIIFIIILCVFIATRILDKKLSLNLLAQINDRRAQAIYERYHWRFLIKDYEHICGTALLTYGGRTVLLLITDRRLIFAKTRFAGIGIESVTECDRLAIKSIMNRDVSPNKYSWLLGHGFRAAIHMKVVGIADPQQMIFTDPRSMARILSMLRQQPKLRPAKNGIRRIIYYEQRNALKLQYVEGFYSEPEYLMIPTFIFSIVFPGGGQLYQGRIRAALLCGCPALAIVLGLIFHPLTLLEIDTEQSLKIITAVIFLWIVSLVEIYTHHHHWLNEDQ